MAATTEPIAVVGLACRLPGAVASPKQLWDLLMEAKSAHGPIPKLRFNADGFYHPDASRPGSIPSKGGYFLDEDIRNFDNKFFGINNLEAKHLDPQQRKLLEVIYECLENGGQRLECIRGSNTGVFVGNFTNDFLFMQFKDAEYSSYTSGTGAATSILANRVSHVFDLHGPSFVMDTACSSSMYAVHMASRALLNGDCDAAIVASANLIQSPEFHLQAVKAGILSPDSTCHTFDAAANGYGRAEGVGALFLKRLSDAQHANDPVRALIRASAVNSNGKTSGISLPDARMQADVVRKAYSVCGLDVAGTQYVEAHGTGTAVGDPIELAGLHEVFGRKDVGQAKLLVGSIKTNLGHSEGASGISSILKVILALENSCIPPTIQIKKLNPRLETFLKDIEIVQSTLAWPKTKNRRASVNSFGFGGANAHVVLEQAPTKSPSVRLSTEIDPARFLIPIFAQSQRSLERMIENYRRFAPIRTADVYDLVYTLGCRRSRMRYRAYTIMENHNVLSLFRPDEMHQTVPAGLAQCATFKKFAYVFSGQGAQWAGMGIGLSAHFAVFRDTIQEFDNFLQSLSSPPQWTLSQILSGADQQTDVNDPSVSQPLCTALQIGIVNLLKSWDILADTVIGHSSGEIAAAYTCGALTAHEAILVAYFRGTSVSKTSNDGSMMAVALDCKAASDSIKQLCLDGKICIACANSPESTTLSGDRFAMQMLRQYLESRSVFTKTLNTNGKAYHSSHMQQVGGAYEHELNFLHHDSRPLTTGCTMISSVTGTDIARHELRKPAYWRANLESIVQFEHAAVVMFQSSQHSLIEIGPHSVLKSPLKQIWSSIETSKPLPYLSTLLRMQNSHLSMLKMAGELHLSGIDLPFDHINCLGERNVVTDLPPYPWDHESIMWYESRISRELRNKQYPRHHLLGSVVPGGPATNKSWRNMIRVKDIAWLKDHRLHDSIVFPGSAYIAIAMEALRQSLHLQDLDHSVRLRDFYIIRALVLLEDSDGIELMTTMTKKAISASVESNTSYTFKISSTSSGLSSVHAVGEISLDNVLPTDFTLPWDQTMITSHRGPEAWYELLSEVGLCFGPSFRTIGNTRYLNSTGLTDSLWMSRANFQSYGGNDLLSTYHEDQIHPTILDAAFQAAILSSNPGGKERLKARIPVSIQEVFINCSRSSTKSGEILARSAQRSCGTMLCDVDMKDVQGKNFVSMTGLRLALYDTLQKSNGIEHRKPMLQVSWKPDIDLVERRHEASLINYIMSQRHCGHSISSASKDFLKDISTIIQLYVHKHPQARILVLAVDCDELSRQVVSSLQPVDNIQRMARLSFGDVSQGKVICWSTEMIPEGAQSRKDLDLVEDEDEQFDMVITQHAQLLTRTPLDTRCLIIHIEIQTKDQLRDLLRDDADLLCHQTYCDVQSGVAVSSLSLYRKSQELARRSPRCSDLVYLVHLGCAMGSDTGITSSDVKSNIIISSNFQDYLYSEHGVRIKFIQFDNSALSQLPLGCTAIFAVDLQSSVLSSITSSDLRALQLLIERAKTLVWLTNGDLLRVSDPNASLAYGLSRALALEQPALKVALVDLDHPSLSHIDELSTFDDIIAVLDQCEAAKQPDLEFIRSKGLLNCSRFIPDSKFNGQFRQKIGQCVVSRPLSSLRSCRLETKHPGSLDNLFFRETDSRVTAPAEGFLHLEVRLVGLNHKDLAVAFSTIDTPNGNCALEYTAKILNPVPGGSLFKAGDLVLVMAPMDFNTHVRVPEWACQKIEELHDEKKLVTLPIVFATALHAICDLARIQKGESILIHAGASSLGQAAIQIARMMGAEIYVTAGTEKKKRFLMQKYNIEPRRIFSSRDDSFLARVMEETQRKGVDVVLSAVGEDLLIASLRCCAIFGRFIDVGRRNLQDAGLLNMSIFERNISFTSFDVSHYYYSKRSAHHRTWSRLLSQALDLYRRQDITAIDPIELYSASDVVKSFQSLRSADRIGKIVIDMTDTTALVRYSTVLTPQKEYILVGGLGGLGRSLSRWLLERGARNITFLSRSGSDNVQAAEHVQFLNSSGANVQVIKGSVVCLKDVETAVGAARGPIGGIIHAAMGLNESLFSMMRSEQWLEAIEPKVHGAWNLHRSLTTHEKDLEFFAITSSINGSVGTATESNYCAANSFLDSFARYRRGLGLKAVSIGFGMISQVGYLHEHPDIEKLLIRKGIHPINEQEMLQIFDIALSSDSLVDNRAHILTGVEFNGLQAQRQQGFEGDNHLLHDPRCAMLAAHFAKSVVPTGLPLPARNEVSFTAELSKAIGYTDAMKNTFNAKQVHELVLHNIKEKIGNLLLVKPQDLEASTMLSTFGMDSMLAAEFRAHVYHVLQADLPFMAVLGATTTIRDIADMITEDLRRSSAQGATWSRATGHAESRNG